MKPSKMRRFRFRWRDGSMNDGEGRTPEEALTLLGFGAGAVPALDWWDEMHDTPPLCPPAEGGPSKTDSEVSR